MPILGHHPVLDRPLTSGQVRGPGNAGNVVLDRIHAEISGLSGGVDANEPDEIGEERLREGEHNLGRSSVENCAIDGIGADEVTVGLSRRTDCGTA